MGGRERGDVAQGQVLLRRRDSMWSELLLWASVCSTHIEVQDHRPAPRVVEEYDSGKTRILIRFPT